MAHPKILIIKESIAELRQLKKGLSKLLSTRVKALIIMKQHEKIGISKREVASLIGVNHNSVQSWRSMYEKGGLAGLLKRAPVEGRPSILNKEEHIALEKKLKNPSNNLRGYVELQEWINNEFKKDIKYNTLLKYSMRNFGSKVKVARKSHIKKDQQAVDTFKKTSVKKSRK